MLPLVYLLILHSTPLLHTHTNLKRAKTFEKATSTSYIAYLNPSRLFCHILHFVNGTLAHSLYIQSNSSLSIYALADADWLIVKLISNQQLNIALLLVVILSTKVQNCNTLLRIPLQV